MSIDQVVNAPWSRKHDMPGTGRTAPKILYPTSLADLIEICKHRPSGAHLKAAGSHWALSSAAVSDDIFIETHDPNNVHQAMGRTLYDVVPGCLDRTFLEVMSRRHPPAFANDIATHDDNTFYLVHIETGKRVYQLYAELDQGDEGNPESLARYLAQHYGNASYYGPWAFHTLGGAGGQTVFGALTTGTHGGDFRLPPIADDVAALHLVADGGKHYWIEPAYQTDFADAKLTDDNQLKAIYGGLGKFEIIRDNDLFNAVLISAGRFGVVYSIVLRAVRQYSLHEQRRLNTWQDIKGLVGDPNSTLYKASDSDPNRFLQIAVSLTPYHNFQRNLCGVTRRWNAPPAPSASSPNGRSERVGAMIRPFDAQIQGPRFEFAGNSIVYTPDPDQPNVALAPNFLELACANGDIVRGVLQAVCDELREFIEENTVLVGGLIASAAALGVGGGLLALLAPLAVILATLLAILAVMRGPGQSRRLGEVMNELIEVLLNRPLPGERAAGLFVWHMIAYGIFKGAQGDLDYNAISYAVMDRHDYTDRSCNANADSIEVFFDATDPMLIAFVDEVLEFEVRQELEGRAFVGYLSLRFTTSTRALIGMQRWDLTCAVEIAGLKDVDGVTELIDFAIMLSRDPNFSGILHWGQRNPSTAADIEHRFGAGSARNDLAVWRRKLSSITDGGRLDGFSSAFTRGTGLEVRGV
jgi:hypothetical protein